MRRETVVPVEIIRPRDSWERTLGNIAGTFANLAVAAWIVMLLAPAIYKPVGYWQTFAFIFVIREVLSDTSGYRLWTRGPKS